MYTMCCDISNYFVKNAQFCHFVRGPWIFTILQFCQKCSILSFCESAVDFFRFFNFVKNAPFCHFVRGPCIFSSLQFCQKCSILSLCERTVDFYAYSILSKMLNFVWEDRKCFDSSILSKTLNFVIFREARGFFFSLFQVCQKLSILSFVKSGLQISILSKIVHFVICEKWTSNYEISISILCVHYVLWYIKLFCQKGSILSLSERPV